MDEAYLRSRVQYAEVLYKFFRFLDKPHREHDFRPVIAEIAAELVQPYRGRFEQVGKKVQYLHNLVLRAEVEYGAGRFLDGERFVSDVGLGWNADRVLEKHPDEAKGIRIKPAHIFLECLVPEHLAVALEDADPDKLHEPLDRLSGWYNYDFSFINNLASRLRYRPKRHPQVIMHYFVVDMNIDTEKRRRLILQTRKHERMHCLQQIIGRRMPILSEFGAVLAEDSFRDYRINAKPPHESRFMAYETIRKFVADVRRNGTQLSKLAFLISTLPARNLRAALRHKKRRKLLLEIIKEEL